jgi:hypothetical protein|uniref:Transmembrane protein n=1 Tax=Panagrolaimus sp. PS1159 TaxID=55785 RepID=A0AC35G0I9_9BILA
MNAVKQVSYLARTNNLFAFGLGIAAGAGFELFKIYFSFNGVNYYSVFKKKQLQKELEKYENHLKELDSLAAQSAGFSSSSKQFI